MHTRLKPEGDGFDTHSGHVMKNGDYGLTNIDGLLGLAIGFGQVIIKDGSRYEHAFVYLGSNKILEAKPFGARIADVSEYKDREVVYSNLDLTDQQRDAIVKNALMLVGTLYSFLDYLALGLARWGVKPKWLTKFMASKKHMICSQLVDECYRRAGIELFNDGRLPQDVTPGDLTYVGNINFAYVI